MREERGVVALVTVAFLAFAGVVAIAFVLAAARINNTYTLLNNAAQSAAFSAVSSAEVSDGAAVVPCDNYQLVRQTYSGCIAGDAYQASEEMLRASFSNNPGGYCFSTNCSSGKTPVYMGSPEASWIQVFNTEEGGVCTPDDFQIERDAVSLAGSNPPTFLCWVVRQNRFEKPYSIRYSNGVIVRLRTKIDLFLFRDRELEVYAGATISQGE